MENLRVERDINTTVLIENQFEYDVILDLDLTPLGDFGIKITFNNVNLKDIENLNNLFNTPKALTIDCPYFKQNDYNINYIVVEKISIPCNGTVIWDCLSDEPINLEIE